MGDESTSNEKVKLQINACQINKNININKHNLRNEETNEKPDYLMKQDTEVYNNDILKDSDESDEVYDTVQITQDDGLNSCYDESDSIINSQDISNPQSESIETDIKSANVMPDDERQYLENFNVWNARADDEMNAAKESGLRHLRGLHTVICVDTSSSVLRESGLTQVRAFVNDYLNGLKEIDTALNDRDENVALVTFGKKTHVAQRLTNDYNKVLQVFEKIEFGGPTPMYGGLAMAIAAAQSTMSHSANVNGMTINTKIVLLTDGWPTDSCMVKGQDDVNDQINDDTQHEVLSKIAEVAARPYLDLFVVPVGNANMQFLELVINIAEGKMQSYDEGTHFSRRSILCALAAPQGPLSSPFSELSGLAHMLPLRLTEKDKELVKILREEGKRIDGFGFKLKGNDDHYHESNDSDLPAIGLRVVRGPDWTHKYQDAGGPGTIIGHSETTGSVWVEWDRNAETNVYRYNEQNGYAVLLTDEPREIFDGSTKRIAVGCIVKPGNDFNYSKEAHVNRQDKGVVIKVLTSREDRVLVRWNNYKRVRGEYSFGKNDCYEVELCKTNKPEHELFSTDATPKRKSKIIKNKNQ